MKCLYSQSYGFSSSHVCMWGFDYKEARMLQNGCFWIVKKTLESPLDCEEIKPDNPRGNQPWIFIGWIDAEALILWPPDAKSWLIGKDPDAGKDWRQEKGMTENEMVWMASPIQRAWVWANSRSWWWTGKLACCSPWGCKESDTIERLNWTDHGVWTF